MCTKKAVSIPTTQIVGSEYNFSLKGTGESLKKEWLIASLKVGKIQDISRNEDENEEGIRGK